MPLQESNSTSEKTVFMLLKRDRNLQCFDEQKLRISLNYLTWGLNMNFVDLDRLVRHIRTGLVQELPTRKLQMHAARSAACLADHHPDYSLLAGRIYIQMIHKDVDKSFTAAIQSICEGMPSALSQTFIDVVTRHGKILDEVIKHHRDFDMSFRSVNTFATSYLFRTNVGFVERPQHVYMRVAIAIHAYNLDRVIETYEALSLREYTHASPILYNAGTTFPFYASCYIHNPVRHADDLLQDMTVYDKDWMADGGVSVYLGSVPSRRASPYNQPGLMPLVRVLDSHAQYASLARQHRLASLTVYIPIWHADIRSFIVSRTTRVSAAERVWRVFPALCLPDLFMNRLRSKGSWTLFDPVDVPELNGLFGEAFDVRYQQYEHSLKDAATIDAYDLWNMIVDAQRETGTPFIVYIDSINTKNNQRHLGMIHSSGLCCESTQYSSPDETGVCLLSSIALPKCIHAGSFDFEALQRVTRIAVANTDALIDIASYPTDAAARSAMYTRPIGIGVQGLWDVFIELKMAVDSDSAKKLNIAIFETIYFAALDTSCDLARTHGPYARWTGSPGEGGELQFDMWDISPSDRHDFRSLKNRISQYGLRNSLLTAQMPTVSTASLLGNCAGIEPYISALDMYRTRDGDLPTFRPSLVEDLIKVGKWTETVRTRILYDHGSIQGVADVPDDIKLLHRTVWEIDPKVIIELAADRAPFIDQSQSMSIYVTEPTTEKLTELQLYAWERGLKTGVYDLCTRNWPFVPKLAPIARSSSPILRPPPFPYAHTPDAPIELTSLPKDNGIVV